MSNVVVASEQWFGVGEECYCPTFSTEGMRLDLYIIFVL